MRKLMTIGYEGADLSDFLATISDHDVDIVVDVRAVAVSRRRGFSKNKLAEALTTYGVGYLHLKALGDPKEGREAARAGFMHTFRRIYSAQLQTDEAQEALARLSRTIDKQVVCLLCFEADHRECHRTLIVDEINALLPVEVDHLKVSREHARAVPRTGGGLSQGRAAA